MQFFADVNFTEDEVFKPDKILLPYQIEVNASVSLHALTVIDKSRRVGITWGIAAEAILTSSLKTSDGGMDTLYLGTSMDMAREFIDACAEWALALKDIDADIQEYIFIDQEKGKEDREINAYRINFASGKKIIALSSAPRSLRGRQGLVVIDEAAFHDDFPEVLKAALALQIWGGKIVVISTQNGFDNPYNQLINDIKNGRRPGNVIRIDFDDAIRCGLYRRICEKTKIKWTLVGQAVWRQEIIDTYGEGAAEELFCIPSDGDGVGLSRAIIEKNMDKKSPVIKWEKPSDFSMMSDLIRAADCLDFCERELLPLLQALNPNLRTVLGEDFGRSGDLTVLIPLQIQKNLVRKCPFTVELRNIPHRQQEQILFFIIDRLPKFSGAKMDARGNGESLAEFAAQRYGDALIDQVKLSGKWYAENMPIYKAAFEDGTISLSYDEDIIADHRDLVYVKGVLRLPESGGRRKGTDGKQRHGDSAIAGVLAYSASLMDVVAIDFSSAGKNRSDHGDYQSSRHETKHNVGFGSVSRSNNKSGYR